MTPDELLDDVRNMYPEFDVFPAGTVKDLRKRLEAAEKELLAYKVAIGPIDGMIAERIAAGEET